MKCVYTRLLTDDELRAHLERGESIGFKGPAPHWQAIEEQIERLGFGDAYAVSRTGKGTGKGDEDFIRVSRLHAPEGS